MKTDFVPVYHDVLPYVIMGAVGFLFAVIILVWIRRTVQRWRFGSERENVIKHWQAVQELVGRGDATSYRLAIIQADAVLDVALKIKAFPGVTTGDRVKFASRKYPVLKNVFWARALRNKIVHEAGSELKIREAKAALEEFESALMVLGAL